MAIEIVDLPINSMVIFHSYVAVYQRVTYLLHPVASLSSFLPVFLVTFPCFAIQKLKEPPFLLVGGTPTPLKNMSSSVGMMTFPIHGKIKHVPNHQPACLV